MKVRILERKVEYRNQYQTVNRVRARIGGVDKIFFVDDHGTRVGMVATKSGKVLLVRQERLLTGGTSLEIPGGRVDAGESLEDAARRECFEETGYACGAVRPLVHYMPGMDTVLNPTYVFAADGPRRRGRPLADATERTKPVWVPMDDCLAMIRSGHIRCGLTITALLALDCLAPI